MKDGYIRVAAGSFDTSIANVTNNSKNIIKLIDQAYQNQTKVLVLPELCLTGYTCEDLFNQERLLNEAKKQLQIIIDYTANKDIVVIIGLPYQHLNSLYNVAAIIHQGELLALVPKTHIPNYQEFYEARRFEKAPEKNITTNFNGKTIPFGTKFIFASTTNPDFKFGVEICEDLWMPDAPSINLALNGANMIFNPSASNEITTKSDYRRSLVSLQSAKLVCGYVYCNAGDGESTTDVVFSGHHIIAENGTIINESQGFTSEMIYGDLDLKKLSSERRKMTTFKSLHDYDVIYFDSTDVDLDTNYYYDPHPFVPSDSNLRAKRCKEVFDIQTRALMQRLKATGIKKVVIGISGGLDSTLALLVCTMAFKQLNYDSKDIIAITMPCFGTTSRTKNNALGLMEELNVTSLEIDIADSVRVQFRDIEQDENVHDVTYENVQARTRTEILMNKANQVGGLVIGTGDLSEVALGWSTYNGDHMSMYAVNVSVPKTLVRYLVDYVASLYHGQKIETILKDVLAYSIWTSISTYARTLMLSFMTTILGVTSPEGEGSAQIAIYSIAYQIETYVSYFATSFGTIFYPEVSRRLYAGGQLTEENKKNFGAFNLKVAHIQTIILFIVCAGLLLCGNEFLQLWLVGDLKANHETIYFCILAICSTAIFLYPLQVLETALNTSGYIKYQALANLAGSIVAIALAFLLSYYWGAFGCCVAIAIGTVVRIIMLNIFGHKFIAFRIGEYHLKTYASFIIPGAITIVFGLIIYKFLPQVSWLYFIIKVVAISAVYAISLSIFGLNKYERDKTLGFLKKFERKIKSLTGKVME